MGKGQVGMSRIDLNGGDIEFERFGFNQVEAAQTAHLDS